MQRHQNSVLILFKKKQFVGKSAMNFGNHTPELYKAELGDKNENQIKF